MKLDLLFNLYAFLISTNSHLGSKSRPLLSKRPIHPKATSALLGKKEGFPYINPFETLKGLIQSLRVIKFVVENGGSVLVVNTNPALSPVINKLVLINSLEGVKKGEKGKISFCNERWIGGLLSNGEQLSKSIFVFKRFFQQFDPFLFENNINLPVYTEMKKRFSGLIPLEGEQLISNFFFLKQKQGLTEFPKKGLFPKKPFPLLPNGKEEKPLSGVKERKKRGTKTKTHLESKRGFLPPEKKSFPSAAPSGEVVRKVRLFKDSYLEKTFGVEEKLDPTILFLIDPNQNQHLLAETNQLKIPTIAITNSNTDQSGIQYSIPGNMNSIHFVYYCLKCVLAVANKGNLDGKIEAERMGSLEPTVSRGKIYL